MARYTKQVWTDGVSALSAARMAVIETGIFAADYPEAVRAYHNASQNVTASTWTTLALNSERFDESANAASTMHDLVTNNSRLTALVAGIYQISGNFRFSASTTGNSRYGRILLNGATVIAEGGSGYNPVANIAVPVVMSTLYKLAVNDYVQIQGYSDGSGAGLTVEVQANFSPEFMMVRVA